MRQVFHLCAFPRHQSFSVVCHWEWKLFGFTLKFRIFNNFYVLLIVILGENKCISLMQILLKQTNLYCQKFFMILEKFMFIFCNFFSQNHWCWLDSNSWHLDDGASFLPLRFPRHQSFCIVCHWEWKVFGFTLKFRIFNSFWVLLIVILGENKCRTLI
jgi:hypothetical protein